MRNRTKIINTEDTIGKKLISDATVLLILNLMASALNYLYQILVANILTVDSFGTINTIFSVMLIIAVPGSAITMLAARYLAICLEKHAYYSAKQYVRKLTYIVTLLGIAVFVVGIFLSRILGSFLRISDYKVLLIMLFICALGYYHPLYSGCMSGMKKFLVLGLYGMMIPIYKIAGLLLALLFDSEYYRLITCLVIIIPGSILTAVLGLLIVKNAMVKKEDLIHELIDTPDKKYWIDSLLLNIALILYINIDILIARHIGGPEISGTYSAVTLFGRIIYYGATSIGTVLLPIAATKNENESDNLLKRMLMLVFGVSVIGLIMLNIIKVPLIQFVYGENYMSAVDYVPYVSLISIAIGLLTILTNYFVGINYVKVPRNIMLSLMVMVIVIMISVKDLIKALLFIGVSGIVCVCVMYVMYKIHVICKFERDI